MKIEHFPAATFPRVTLNRQTAGANIHDLRQAKLERSFFFFFNLATILKTISSRLHSL